MYKVIDRNQSNQSKLDRLLALEPKILKSKLLQLDYFKWAKIPRNFQELLLNHAYSEG